MRLTFVKIYGLTLLTQRDRLDIARQISESILDSNAGFTDNGIDIKFMAQMDMGAAFNQITIVEFDHSHRLAGAKKTLIVKILKAILKKCCSYQEVAVSLQRRSYY